VVTDSVKVLTPSHNRAGKVKSLTSVEGIALLVSENEVSVYREHYPDTEIVVVPDDQKGLAAARQFALDTFGSVFMVDDDCPKVRDMMADGAVYLSPVEANDLIQNTALTARELGAYLFGFSHVPFPIMANPMNPMVITGFVQCHSIGILSGSSLYFHPQISLHDDYWISALNAYHHRIILKDMRYYFQQIGTFQTAGGLSDQRTMALEADRWRELERYFGNIFERKTDSHLGKVKHDEMRFMKLPF
jgi:hypothetical protein